MACLPRGKLLRPTDLAKGPLGEALNGVLHQADGCKKALLALSRRHGLTSPKVDVF